MAAKRPLTPTQRTLRGRIARPDLKAVPLASLSPPQRRLVSALLEAAKAASPDAVATDTKLDALAAGKLPHRREPRP